jgi:hypothetical protein
MQRVVLCGASPTRSLPERPRGDGSFLLLPTTCQRAKCCCHPGVPALLFCVVLRTEKYFLVSFETPGARLADTSFRSHPLDIGGGASQGSSSSSQGRSSLLLPARFPSNRRGSIDTRAPGTHQMASNITTEYLEGAENGGIGSIFHNGAFVASFLGFLFAQARDRPLWSSLVVFGRLWSSWPTPPTLPRSHAHPSHVPLTSSHLISSRRSPRSSPTTT